MKIRATTELERLKYLKEFLQSQIDAYQSDLQEVNSKILKLERGKENGRK